MHSLPPFLFLAQSSLPAGTMPLTSGNVGHVESTGTGPASPGTHPADTQPAPGGSSNPFGSLLFIAPLAIVVFLLMFRGPRKEEKARKKMIEQMKKGDRVMTIGGMIGSVVDIRGDEVILKVDEANNVKARYIKSAIQKVLDDDAKPEDKK